MTRRGARENPGPPQVFMDLGHSNISNKTGTAGTVAKPKAASQIYTPNLQAKVIEKISYAFRARRQSFF
jgi:hypothetical protein